MLWGEKVIQNTRKRSRSLFGLKKRLSSKSGKSSQNDDDDNIMYSPSGEHEEEKHADTDELQFDS